MNPVFPRSWKNVFVRMWPFSTLKKRRKKTTIPQSIRYSVIVALFLIAVLTVFVRFDRLGNVPPIFNPDEASIAYNAYLLLETGKDEWGKSWPLVLEAFGDQKIGGYTYLVVGSFMLFGVSDTAVRLPAALAGTGVVFLSGLFVYLLHTRVSRFEDTYTDKKIVPLSMGIALMTMAIMAVQPVFIWYSRVAFEATVALACTLGILLLLFSEYPRALARRSKLLLGIILISIVGLMVAAVFLYNVPLVIIPFIFLPVPIWYGITEWKRWLLIVLIGSVTWIVLMVSAQGLTAQKSKITLFGDPHIQFEQLEYYQQYTDPLQRKLLGNKYVFFTKEISQRYFASLRPDFIVENTGGHPWHVYQSSGYLTTPVYVLGWLGVLGTIWMGWMERSKFSRELKIRFFMGYLMFVSLIPAVITVNAPHATRTLFFFIGWIYFATLGVLLVADTIKILIAWLVTNNLLVHTRFIKKSAWVAMIVITAAVIAFPSGNYVSDVLVSEGNISDWSNLQAGLPEVLEQAEQKYSNNETVAIHDPRGFTYILVAWYTKLDPQTFFNTISKNPPDTINFKYGSRVGRYILIRDAQTFELEQPDIPLILWDNGWRIND